MKGGDTEVPVTQEIEHIESLVAEAYQDIKEILTGASPGGVLADEVIEQILEKKRRLSEPVVREAIWQGLNRDWVLRPDRHLDIAA